MCIVESYGDFFCYLSSPLNNRVEDWIKHLCFHVFDLMSESRSVEQFTARTNHHCGLAATLTSFFFFLISATHISCHLNPVEVNILWASILFHCAPLSSTGTNQSPGCSGQLRFTWNHLSMQLKERYIKNFILSILYKW